MRIATPQFVLHHKKLVIALVPLLIFLPVVAVTFAYAWIAPYDKYVLNADDVQMVQGKYIQIGMVMGGGVRPDGTPYRELQGRLDVAARAYQRKEVQKLILTGDNSTSHYDEPAAMLHYLVDKKHIPKDKLQVDDAGRDTYASCERATKVFGQSKIIIFSAQTHLSRAIFICRSFGIEAYGIASHVEANNAHRRELLARVKAMIDVYVHGEPTILGDPIRM